MRIAACLVATVVFFVVAASANAQPAPSWTGYYVGVNIGYSWGNADSDTAANATIDSFPATPITNDFSFGGDRNQDVNGIVGGGQFGYNYQFNPAWLLGIEADLQGSAQRGSDAFLDSIAGSVCNIAAPPVCLNRVSFNGDAVTNLEAKILWFGTVRARVGWLPTDQFLIYATGGLAYGQVSVSGDLSIDASAPATGVTWGPNANPFSASNTNVGFAIGGGVEGRFVGWLPPNWTWKLEYLYVDLGSFDTSTPFIAESSFPAAFTDMTGTMTIHTRFTDNIVRFGLNYQFAPPPSLVSE